MMNNQRIQKNLIYFLKRIKALNQQQYLKILDFTDQMQPLQKGPSSAEIQANWDKLGTIYQSFQQGMMTFLLSLTNLMKLQEASNILEIGVGAGGHLSYIINNKSSTASYYAIDISSTMVQLSYQKLKENFMLYNSNLTYEEWLQKQHLFLKKANAQDYQQKGVKFDRIICNMILMIAEDPEKLLINMHKQSQNGCMIGISVWGEKKLNTFQRYLDDAVEQIVGQTSKRKSPYDLYNKVTNLLQKTGWKVLVRWQQNSAIPKLQSKEVQEYFKYTINLMKNLDQKQKEQVFELAMKKIDNQLNNKRVLNFPAQLVIAQKIDVIQQK